MTSLERSLDETLNGLRNRLRELRSESGLSREMDDDEIDSIASSTLNSVNAPHRFARTVRFSPSAREVDILKKKVSQMRQENLALRNEVSRLKALYDHKDPIASEEKKDDDSKKSAAKIQSEGGVLKFIRGSSS